MSLFIYLFLFLLFWLFLSPFYYYIYDILSHILYIFSHMKNVFTLSLSLSLSLMFLFLCEFFIFGISTLDWCIYVFFRILLWVAIWFCIFQLSSSSSSFFLIIFNYYFFFMIVKCYSIAYKYSLQEYNVILLNIMAWIIWYLTYDYIYIYIFFFLCFFFSHFIFYFSPQKGDYSLSLYIYYLFFFATLL